MQKLFAKNQDTEDTMFFSALGGKNCHFFQDTKPGHGLSGRAGDLDCYLWFPHRGTHTPLSSYLGAAGASVCPPHRGR
jgi:hypothetical protein